MGSGSLDLDLYGGKFSAYEKTGNSIWTLTGDDNQSNWTVDNGTLIVDGAVGDVGVSNGGLLKGTGTLGATTINSGGRHAPGNSIGVQTIVGNYDLNAGSTLEIEVQNAKADRLAVQGVVTIRSGAKLNVVDLGGHGNLGQSGEIVFIDNDGTDPISGTFDPGDITENFALLGVRLDYAAGDGNDLALYLFADKTLNDFADTPNRKAVAGVLPQDGTGSVDIASLRDGEVGTVLDQLSGPIYAAERPLARFIHEGVARRVSARLDSFSPRRAHGNDRRTVLAANAGSISDESGAEGPARPADGAWGRAIGGRGKLDGGRGMASVDYDWHGIVMGLDAPVSADLRLGVVLAYVNGGVRQNVPDAAIDTDNFTVGVYGRYDLGAWRLFGRADAMRVGGSGSRRIVYDSTNREARSDYANWMASMEAGISRDIDLDANWRLEPYGRVEGNRLTLDGLREHGAGPDNLSREEENRTTGGVGAGIRVARRIGLDVGLELRPRLGIGWERFLGSTANTATLAFDSTSSFTVAQEDTDRNTLTGDIELDLLAGEGITAHAGYHLMISSDRREHEISGGVSIAF